MLRLGGRGTQDQEQKGKRRQDGGDAGNQGSEERPGQQLTTEIQQIIRDELQQIMGSDDRGQRAPRDRDHQRFQIRKPTKVGARSGQGRGASTSRDPVIRHDIELLTQVQMELSTELAENLKQLKAVIAESQALAERIQAVLGQSKTPN